MVHAGLAARAFTLLFAPADLHSREARPPAQGGAEPPARLTARAAPPPATPATGRPPPHPHLPPQPRYRRARHLRRDRRPARRHPALSQGRADPPSPRPAAPRARRTQEPRPADHRRSPPARRRATRGTAP